MLNEPHFIDSHSTKAVECIVLLTGKIYYDLVKKRATRPAAAREKVSFIRIEELAPFSLPAPQGRLCATMETTSERCSQRIYQRDHTCVHHR